MDGFLYTCSAGGERVDLPSCDSKCLYEWIVFSEFWLCEVVGNLCSYVSPKNRITFGGVGVGGEGYLWSRLAMDVRGEMVHVRLTSHSGTVMSWGLELH